MPKSAPLYLRLTWKIERKLWEEWESLIEEECPGCGAVSVAAIIEPILQEALEDE